MLDAHLHLLTMSLGERCYCIAYESQIYDDTRKYSTSGSLLFRVYVGVTMGKRVGFKDYACGSCRRRYARWRDSMDGDFDLLCVPMTDSLNQERYSSTVSSLIDFDFILFVLFCYQPMEVDAAKAAISLVFDNVIDEEKPEFNETGSVELSIWRTSKSHR